MPGRHQRRIVSAVLCLAALGLVEAQQKPNFSGTWKLNAEKSDFGAMPVPISRTDKITHDDPSLIDAYTQERDAGVVNAELKYSTDGKETTNNVRGSEIKTTAKWDGNELTIAGKGSYNGGDVTIDDRWSLSADGKTLTIKRHVNTSMGETDQRIVLEKQ